MYWLILVSNTFWATMFLYGIFRVRKSRNEQIACVAVWLTLLFSNGWILTHP
jgi:hypothetical protein